MYTPGGTIGFCARARHGCTRSAARPAASIRGRSGRRGRPAALEFRERPGADPAWAETSRLGSNGSAGDAGACGVMPERLVVGTRRPAASPSGWRLRKCPAEQVRNAENPGALADVLAVEPPALDSSDGRDVPSLAVRHLAAEPIPAQRRAPPRGPRRCRCRRWSAARRRTSWRSTHRLCTGSAARRDGGRRAAPWRSDRWVRSRRRHPGGFRIGFARQLRPQHDDGDAEEVLAG